MSGRSYLRPAPRGDQSTPGQAAGPVRGAGPENSTSRDALAAAPQAAYATPTLGLSGFADLGHATLKWGDVGPQVEWLQVRLNNVTGANLDVDGEFGDLTKAALSSFQLQHGLVADGVLRADSERTLEKARNASGPASTDAKGGGEDRAKGLGLDLPDWMGLGESGERRADAVRDTIPHLHVILEQLARCAYDKRDPSNDAVVSRQYDLSGIGYRQQRMISDPATGLQVVLYAPVRDRAPVAGGNAIPGLGSDKLPTVVAFRGSDFGGEDQWEDVWDDANSAGVGTYQFAMHEGEIRALFLEANGLGFGKPFSIGHSLGGAQAQLAAARMGDLISEVVTFQAPGINKEEAARVDPDQIKSTHHRVTGDAVPTAGAQLTQGTLYSHTTHDKKAKFYGHDVYSLTNFAGHVDLPLASMNADRKDAGDEHVQGLDNLFPQGADRPHFSATMNPEHQATLANGTLEGGRRALGAVPTAEWAAAANAWRDVRDRIPGWLGEGLSPKDVGAQVRRYLLGVDVRSFGIPYVAKVRVPLEKDTIDRLVRQAELLAEQGVTKPPLGRSGGW